ncbi:glycosyltransferase family 1 protein [Azoarcus sp. CIB]|uniref:glycosyltransferase n=1 Tax=Aromatoleum sp. (strain CIB) TaxID=198107 RepID=UPI00067CFB57|nr:glycosyltransferase family 1 protein [Azoarcus sp. CIB]
MADLPTDAVWMLPDDFAEGQLVEALEILRRQPPERSALGARGRAYVHAVHSPEVCADQYFRGIEAFYDRASVGRAALIRELGCRIREEEGGQEVVALADALSRAFPSKRPARKLFVDVSVVVRDDFKTGIQRVVRALLLGLIDSPPSGYLIEPVYLSDEGGNWHYRYARDYTLALLGCTQGWLPNERVEPHVGDILIGLDLAGGYVIQADRCGVYEGLMNSGVHVAFVVYDLIPIQFENVYPPGFKEGHEDWLRVVSKADSAICISRSVAQEMADWVRANGVQKRRPLDIRWFHLGADLKNSRASEGMDTNAEVVLQKLTSVPSFLLVGTLEPRKGHAQVLSAFELLWERGLAANLVIVGKAGWMVDSLVQKLRAHPELDKRLLWLEGISDEYLDRIYAASSCLIAASEGEGFGLPLIEAAQYKVPIIARDLAVFREVAGSHAHYFTGLSAVDLAGAIDEWLELFRTGQYPTSDGLPWLTWKESTDQLKAVLLPQDTLPAQESRSATAAKIEGRELSWADGA